MEGIKCPLLWFIVPVRKKGPGYRLCTVSIQLNLQPEVSVTWYWGGEDGPVGVSAVTTQCHCSEWETGTCRVWDYLIYLFIRWHYYYYYYFSIFTVLFWYFVHHIVKSLYGIESSILVSESWLYSEWGHGRRLRVDVVRETRSPQNRHFVLTRSTLESLTRTVHKSRQDIGSFGFSHDSTSTFSSNNFDWIFLTFLKNFPKSKVDSELCSQQ